MAHPFGSTGTQEQSHLILAELWPILFYEACLSNVLTNACVYLLQISLLLSFEPYAITTTPSTPVSDSESLLVREINS